LQGNVADLHHLARAGRLSRPQSRLDGVPCPCNLEAEKGRHPVRGDGESLMCKLALLAAMLAATVPGEGDSRYQCWSSCRVEFDAELIVMEADIVVPEYAVPEADPVETGRFTGVGWTYGNLFDDLEDNGYPLGPGDYSNLELNSLTDVDGLSLLVSI
jgi:hypothetical protein